VTDILELPSVGETPLEHRGLALVKELIVRPSPEGGLGWLFRDLPAIDFGIDAQIEMTELQVDQRLVATGRILSVQVKTGPSYFQNDDGDSWSVYIRKATVNYWRNHSVPVLLVLVDVEKECAFWVRGDAADHQETEKSFRIRVPKEQRLDSSAIEELARLAQHSTEEGRYLARLQADLPLMAAAVEGTSVVLDVMHWHNKSSGRMDFWLGVRSDEVSLSPQAGLIPFSSGTLIGTSADPLDAASMVAPWADAGVDAEFEDAVAEDLYQEYLAECGTWDSEDQVYVDSRGDFDGWRARRREVGSGLSPYYQDGEVSCYRLLLSPNGLATGYVTVQRFVSESTGTSLPKWTG
jgi:hypothetical protein